MASERAGTPQSEMDSDRQAGPAHVESSMATRPESLLPYLLMGVALGFVFTKSEVVSWFRIHEMFRFQAFHMYGIIGSAVAVGAAGIQIIKRLGLRSLTNRPMEFAEDRFVFPGWQYILGGTAFGLGWGLLGTCPGPIYVLFGNGVTVIAVSFLGALAGVWTYGAVRHRLPHS